jgi:hypothetical protein
MINRFTSWWKTRNRTEFLEVTWFSERMKDEHNSNGPVPWNTKDSPGPVLNG